METKTHKTFSPDWWPGNPPVRTETPKYATGIGQKTFNFDLDPGSDDESNSSTKPSIEITSNFCSGNIKQVELDDDDINTPSFSLYTAVDCEGEASEYVTTYRTWFYFAVRGSKIGQTLKFTILNMNKQTGLFGHDHRPSISCTPSSPKWIRMPQSVTKYTMVDGSMELTFKHVVQQNNDDIRFSFCFPMSYWETQRRLEYLESWFVPRGIELLSNNNHGKLISPRASDPKEEPSRDIYYHRELLTRSLDGRRMDIITITSRKGLDPNLRERSVSPRLFKEHAAGNSEAACGMGGAGLRAHKFPGRKIVYVSCRVHPGETPASHMFEGILRLLLTRGSDDPRAAALRKKFVFKLVPILNPDGVSRGHYRADTRGVNLNRRYRVDGIPNDDCIENDRKDNEPTIHASYTTVLSYFHQGRLQLYLDLHAHASKRGCFMYGNHCETLEAQVENILWARLISINSPYFDFDGCNFSEQNMKTKDKRDHGQSKEGSGRVAIYLGSDRKFPHSYTLEANYNMGRSVNTVPSVVNDKVGKSSPPSKASSSSPKYNPMIWRNVGRACMSSILDLVLENPWSRVPRSRYHNLDTARMVIFNRLRHNTSYKEESKEYKKILTARTKENSEKNRKVKSNNREMKRKNTNNYKDRRAVADLIKLEQKQKQKRESGDMMTRIKSGGMHGSYSKPAPSAPFKTGKSLPRSPIGTTGTTGAAGASGESEESGTTAMATTAATNETEPMPQPDTTATEENGSMWRVTSTHIPSSTSTTSSSSTTTSTTTTNTHSMHRASQPIHQGQHSIVMPAVTPQIHVSGNSGAKGGKGVKGEKLGGPSMKTRSLIPKPTVSSSSKAKPRRYRSGSGSGSNNGWGNEVPSRIPRRPKMKGSKKKASASSTSSVLNKKKDWKATMQKKSNQAAIDRAHRIWDRIGSGEK